MNSPRLSLKPIVAVLSLIALGSFFCGCAESPSAPTTTPTSEPAQATFDSPGQAVKTLIDALRANDSAQLMSILGPGGDQIISSGDDVADTQNRQKFLDSYDAKHQLTIDDNGSVTLDVGADDWPLPIPLVNDGGVWRFDTQAGLDEILNRRIGENELATIQVCLAIVDAQQDYVQQNPGGGDPPQYAQKFFSDPGQKNGLYWPTTDADSSSPLGPLLADAADQGYTIPSTSGAPTPYHGYFYRMLKSQGSSAEGGACDYVVDGKMIGGFAAVAYPAQYGNSGVMTFIVNYDGTVFEKDLGADTESVAKAMTAYDPDSSWKPAK